MSSRNKKKVHVMYKGGDITHCGIDLSKRKNLVYPKLSIEEEIKIGRMCKTCLRTKKFKNGE